MSKKTFVAFITILIVAPLFLQGCGKQADEIRDEAPDISLSETDESSDSDDSSMIINKGKWKLDTDQSQLKWTASRLGGPTHIGTVDIESGFLKADAERITGGEFVIDMTTITESNNTERFLEVITGDDFFAVEDYPEAHFEIRDVLLREDGRYEILGKLTIRDLSKTIIFFAEAQGGGNVMSIEADFTIDRTRWDIIFDSSSFFQNLGDRAIKDFIKFELDLLFEL